MKTLLINKIIRIILLFFKSSYPKFKTGILKLDEIGDYVLFRKYIKNIYDSHGNSIYLIGNKSWESLFIGLDKKYIANFYFIDKKKFNSSFFYKLRTMISLKKLSFDKIIHPTQSRDLFISDYILSELNSKSKIGFKSDYLNSSKKQLLVSDRYYTRLIDCLKIPFEIDKIEKFINEVFQINQDLCNDENTFQRNQDCVIFLGASSPERRWGGYSDLIFKINLYFDNIYLCGGNDVKINFDSNLNSNVINLIGKADLSDFMSLIKKSRLLITNESFAHHLAVQTRTNCVVISNGNNYLRFHPYPKKHLNSIYKIIYPKSFDKNSYNENLPLIDEITTEEILLTIVNNKL